MLTAKELYRRYAKALARSGGLARAAALDPKRRRAIAKKASRARWRKAQEERVARYLAAREKAKR